MLQEGAVTLGFRQRVSVSHVLDTCVVLINPYNIFIIGFTRIGLYIVIGFRVQIMGSDECFLSTLFLFLFFVNSIHKVLYRFGQEP